MSAIGIVWGWYVIFFLSWKKPKISNHKISPQYIDNLVQNCRNSIANAQEFLQSCTKPSIWLKIQYDNIIISIFRLGCCLSPIWWGYHCQALFLFYTFMLPVHNSYQTEWLLLWWCDNEANKMVSVARQWWTTLHQEYNICHQTSIISCTIS